MKLTSISSKLIILLISVFLISAVIYYFSIEEAKIPQMTVQEKKARFKTLIIPAVNDVYAELMAQYQEISASIDAQKNSQQINQIIRYETMVAQRQRIPITIQVLLVTRIKKWRRLQYQASSSNLS